VSDSTAPGRPALVRAIGRYDLLAAVVNGVIGSAIFGMPARIAELTGASSPLAYLLAGLGVLTIVLCFAEVASRFRDPGGPYLYAREAFGTAVGFQAGWLTFWIRVTAVGANLNVLADYLAAAFPAAGAPAARALVMASVLGVITAVNVAGVRQATWAVDAFTAAKLLPLALLAVLGLPRISGEVLASQTAPAPDWTAAVLLLIYAYGGFEAPLIPAGETREPRRDTAFALLGALAVIAVVYMAVQLVVIGVVPAARNAQAPVAAAFETLLGAPGLLLASAAAVVSIFGWALGSVLQSPRVAYSMAERGELPSALARVHPRFRTPDVAILIYSGLALALALAGTFEANATLSAIVRLVTYGLTCGALFVFRRRPGAPEAGFRVPWAAFVVPVALGFCGYLLVTRSSRQAWILIALMAAGEALRRISGRRLIPAGAAGE
jgi:amino acid transporter